MSTPTSDSRALVLSRHPAINSIPIVSPPRHSERRVSGSSSFNISGLSVDVFVRIAAHLDLELLIRLTHVCSSWRRVLCGAPGLWTELNAVNLSHWRCVERVKAIAGRARGSLRRVELQFTPADESILDRDRYETLGRVLRAVSEAGGGRKLESASMDLMGADADDIAYDYVPRFVTFLELVAPSVATLRISTTLDPFPGGAPFWKPLPRLRTLILRTSGVSVTNARSLYVLPAFFGETQDELGSTSLLEEIHLEGPSLNAAYFPSFPHLWSLTLSDLNAPKLYHLLNQAPNLEVLRLRNVNVEIEAGSLGRRAGALEILRFPRLRSIEISGECPSLWTLPATDSNDFLIEAPMLQAADFGSQKDTDVVMVSSDHYSSELSGSYSMVAREVSTLFNLSPSLRMLRLGYMSRVSLDSAIRCFRNAPITLTYLNFSPYMPEGFVDYLDTLVPNLSRLVMCDEVTVSGAKYYQIPSLARLAHRLSQRPSFEKVEITTFNPYDETPPSLDTLRVELADLLLHSISLIQVSLLITEIVLDPYPGSPTFQSFQSDVLHLASPSPSERRSATIGPTRRQMPGDESNLRAARYALANWQERREQEGAIDWFDKQDDKIVLSFIGRDTQTMRDAWEEMRDKERDLDQLKGKEGERA